MILDRIVAAKEAEFAVQRAAGEPARWRERLPSAPPPRPFLRALNEAANRDGVAVIAEVKRASPSRGPIREEADPVEVARQYAAGGAAAVSVLTERSFFHGDPAFLAAVRAAIPLPVLRKDFLLYEEQVDESRCIGADAILLIASLFETAERLGLLLARARQLGMEALVEVHTANELERAAAAGATVIGVNNRDLRTFETDLAVSERLAPLVPAGAFLVAESGIGAAEDVARMVACGARGVLVGEALMRSDDPSAFLRRLRGECS